MKYSVTLTKNALKNVVKLPSHIKEKLFYWIKAVKKLGIQETRKIAGLHDQPLKGNRYGQRSIRLNKGYRAINEENIKGEICIILVLEVNKHEY